jgi:putative DNA primase/helicase
MSIAGGLDPNVIARALGGEVSGDQITAPGPEHSSVDRSLSVKIDPTAPDGFVVNSFAGDDPLRCRDYVRTKVGLPKWEAKHSTGKPWSPTIASYIYRDGTGAPYLRVRRTAAKDFFQQHWDGEKWAKGKPNGPKIPYRLPELLAAAPATPIYICEGEKDCDNLAKLGFVATCNNGGADTGTGTKWTPDLNSHFKDRHVYILPDNDQAGHKHAEHVARSLNEIAASVRVVELPGLAPKGDVSDWLENDPSGARLVKACEGAPLWEPGADGGDARISELAGLPKLAYARLRKQAAEKLGITAAALDDAVKEARAAAAGEKLLLYGHWDIEPWPEAVDAAVLLQSIHDRIRQHVIVSDSGAIAAAVWIAMTWVHERVAVHSPLLMVTSAERDSGKSTLLGLLGFMVRRSLLSVGISAAALYRSIEKWQPAFVIDEADTIFGQNEDLREVVNSGWTRGQGVVRCEPETNEPKLFSTFCPKAIGLKGRKLPDTTLSRAIIVELKRKLPSEMTRDFAHLDDEGLAMLRRKLARWAEDNADKLAAMNPTMPDGFINRVAANWRLLLAIAELAGGAWPERARKAAVALNGAEASLSIKLLSDVRDAFAAREAETLTTQELLDHLTALEEREWSELNRGKPVSKSWLSRQLGKFGLCSDNLGDRRLKGWRIETFEDVFRRYLSPPLADPPHKTAHPLKPASNGHFSQNETAHPENGERFQKCEKANNDGHLSGRAEMQGGSARQSEKPDPWADLDIPECLRRPAPKRCDHCGALEQPADPLNPWEWPGRPDGIWLHPRCEIPWNDGEARE